MPTEIKRPIGQTNSCVQKQRHSIPWLWEGVLANGAVTLLSAPEKIGKTTLLSLLLDRLRAGGELLGRTVWPGKTILCSEENKQLWALRQPPLDFGPDLIFHEPPGPFPMRGRWRRFFNDFLELNFPDYKYDLVVIDSAVNFLPLADRNKRTLRWAISTLRDMADFPVAVLILNQSRNVHRPLAASADIVIEMAIPRGVNMTRRRTFTGVGRYPETLQTVSAELNPEGTDYVLLPDSPAPHPPLLSTLQTLLKASPTPLTCRELLDRWPGETPRPDSLWRTLAHGVEFGHFTAAGEGTKTEPFRFAMARRAEAASTLASNEEPANVQ
ncbi:MAG: AAA family ATPase [Planctomycetes bacterium]|nr:AAA family ATPase [Planctomycetota bacterium]